MNKSWEPKDTKSTRGCSSPPQQVSPHLAPGLQMRTDLPHLLGQEGSGSCSLPAPPRAFSPEFYVCVSALLAQVLALPTSGSSPSCHLFLSLVSQLKG